MKKFSLTSLMITVACVFIFSGYAEAKKAPKAILLGTPSPMTGMFAGFGESVFGMKAAIEDINKLGGVYVKEFGKKLPVKLIVRDVESNPIKTGTLSEDLVLRDKVIALISPPEPVTIHGPVATIADKYKIPHVIGGSPFEPWNGMRMQIKPPWEFSWMMGFRIVVPYPPGDFRAGKPGYTIKDSWFGMMDDFAKQTNKVAGVFASDDPDGVGWYGLFPGALKEWGCKVIGVEKKLGLFPMGTTDFSPIIKEWKKNKVEVLWGNCPAPDFGTMWRQARMLGFKPKIAMVGRAPLFYVDAKSWGGDLPWGVAVEVWWDSSYPPEYAPGIGGTTAKSLHERWTKATGQPLNPGIGGGYFETQVLLDAIERAGSLDGSAINKAIGETDMKTISGRVKFIKGEHFSGIPLFVGQWMKTKKPHVWELPIVYSQHDWLKPTQKPIYPLP